MRCRSTSPTTSPRVRFLDPVCDIVQGMHARSGLLLLLVLLAGCPQDEVPGPQPGDVEAAGDLQAALALYEAESNEAGQSRCLLGLGRAAEALELAPDADADLIREVTWALALDGAWAEATAGYARLGADDAQASCAWAGESGALSAWDMAELPPPWSVLHPLYVSEGPQGIQLGLPVGPLTVSRVQDGSRGVPLLSRPTAWTGDLLELQADLVLDALPAGASLRLALIRRPTDDTASTLEPDVLILELAAEGSQVVLSLETRLALDPPGTLSRSERRQELVGVMTGQALSLQLQVLPGVGVRAAAAGSPALLLPGLRLAAGAYDLVVIADTPSLGLRSRSGEESRQVLSVTLRGISTRTPDEALPEASSLDTQGNRALARGDAPAALAAYARRLREQPLDQEARFFGALARASLEEFDLAARDLARLTVIAPRSTTATTATVVLERVADRLRATDALEEAARAVEEALDGVPEDRALHQRLRGVLENLLQAKPGDSDPADASELLVVAEVERALHRFEAAEGHLQQVLDQSPAHLEALLIRARLRETRGKVASDPALRAGELQRAALDYQRALREGRRDARVYQGLGRTLLALEQAEPALRALTRALELDPEDPITFRELGRTHLALEQVEEALVALTEATNRDPTDPWSRFHLARAHELSGATEDAGVVAELAWALGARSPEVRELLERLEGR
jgi:tetratricopeptide (TPR) repeat protein